MKKCAMLTVFALMLFLGINSAGEIIERGGGQSVTIPQSGQSMTDPAEREHIRMTEPVWKPLQRMTQDKKQNSRIELMVDDDMPTKAIELVNAVEDNWNNGRFDKSIELFVELGEHIDLTHVGIGMGWREPIPTSDMSLWGTDIRIGNRDSVYATGIAINAETGNIFTTLMFEGDSYTTNFSVNFSEDGGHTWTEVFRGMAPYELLSVTPTCTENYCFVAFTSEDDANQARLAHFNATDGDWEIFYDGNHYIHDIFDPIYPDYVKEVHVCSNQDYDVTHSPRLYYTLIVSNGELHYYYTDEICEIFHERTTGVATADVGLDASFNEENGADGKYIWFSYKDIHDTLRIDSYSTSLYWQNEYSRYIGSWPNETTIGAYRDTVTCFFENYQDDDHYIMYAITYNGGLYFNPGVLVDQTVISECPDLTSRAGGGVGLTYRYYTSPREIRFAWRLYAGVPWPVRSQPLSDVEPYYCAASIEYLGDDNYGVIYASWHMPVDGVPFFDFSQSEPEYAYLPGDANMVAGAWSPVVIGSDVTYLVNYFRGISDPCMLGGYYCSADANGDCRVIGADVTYLVSYFRGGGGIQYCPDYPTIWPTSGDLPATEPDGWPGCE